MRKVKQQPCLSSYRSSRTILCFIVCYLSIIQLVSSFADLKLVSVVDNQFQKIFFIQQKTKHIFLTLSCKQKNMLSVLISTELNYQMAPRFNIYGNHPHVPKMASYNDTLFNQCQISIQLNTSNIVQIRRIQTEALIMAINEISFQYMHHRFLLNDQSQKWGFGQRFQKNFDLKDGKWTIYNRDKPWKIDNGHINFSDQTYGHHPVYLARQRATRLYHLVYFQNSHGMLVESTHNSNQLGFNFVGGNLHLIIICGKKDPQQVIEQYHSYIGASHIPPFWSLGYHQSRWGYHNLGYVEQVVEEFKKYRLPLDCMWVDLDYMNDKKIFTINEVAFPPKDLNEMIAKSEIHFVPLLDVAIAVNDVEAVNLGKQLDVFLRDTQSQEYYTGQVWPGKVHYIDYLHPNASLYWFLQLQKLNDKMNFSGIWLDMNEPTNFKGGKMALQALRIQHIQGINTMTIDADLEHYSKSMKKLLHSQVHSYYGHLSTVPTFQFLQRDNRPFIISRSTSVGSGMFSGHWTGDNVANWQFLRLSISGNFLFQIFGIQMVGADICGFYQDTTQQLCSRWMQLGSFYPFARNHNHEKSIPQQPYELGQIVLETSKLSLRTRYSLLKQLYTFMVMKKGKGSFFRPLNFEFYDDQNVYDQQIIQTQFLMGKSLMVAPIVYENEQNRYVYFPGENQQWYQFQIDPKNGRINQGAIYYFVSSFGQVLDNILPSPPLTFLRGGYMLFTTRPASRTHKLTNNFNIFAAISDTYRSQGRIMGINDYQNQTQIQKCIQSGCFYKITIRKFNGFFHLEWQFQGDQSIIGEIIIENIVLVSGNQKWKHSEKITLNQLSGTTVFAETNIIFS